MADDILLSAATRALEQAGNAMKARAERESAGAILESLTSRESEVVQCVVAGLLNKQIAAELGIAEKTVKIHRGRAMRKTGCVSVPDLVRLNSKADGAKKSAPPQPA